MKLQQWCNTKYLGFSNRVGIKLHDNDDSYNIFSQFDPDNDNETGLGNDSTKIDIM